jgi:hypothetical protein
MKRLALLFPILLAACEAPPATEEAPPPSGVFTSIFQGPEPEPVAPEPLPPQVLAALPAGVPPSVVQRGVDGCFLLSIEVTVPPTGYPLRDTAGNPICEGSTAPVAPIDPGLLAGAAPAGLGAPPLTPGSITPPAPLAPLNPG